MRSELGEWVKDYSLKKYNSDWSYCVGLSYKFSVSSNIWRKNIKRLVNKIHQKDLGIDGFIFNEYGVCLSKIHHHLIIKSEIKLKDFSKMINKEWGKFGIVDIMEYDRSLNYCNYITKHYNKLEGNEFDFVSNFID
nr:hypothetical protein [uncultured Flavobacterium sp.]